MNRAHYHDPDDRKRNYDRQNERQPAVWNRCRIPGVKKEMREIDRDDEQDCDDERVNEY
jgi:hypothetical protein